MNSLLALLLIIPGLAIAQGYPSKPVRIVVPFPGSWFGLLAPVGVPYDIAARVQRELVRTLNEPGVRQKLVDGGFEVVASAPEEFLRYARNESEKLGKLIRDNNIRVE